jgi:hypothetical protein
MVFTIRPDEAQSMVEDETQLLGAIAHAARGAVALAMLRRPQSLDEQPPDTLRIQMGRRLVFGRLNDGQFRNELNAESLKTIFDAVQRPVSEDIDPSRYRGKIPAIEIRDGSTVLFREERDGIVTVNAIQFQLEQGNGLKSPTQSQLEPEKFLPLEEAPYKVDKALNIAQAADYLLNPLGEEQPIYDAVAIGGYRIKRGENQIITVSRGESLILVAREGEIITDRVTDEDWQAFQSVYNRLQPQQPEIEFNATADEKVQNDDQVTLTVDVAEASAPQDLLPAIAIAEREVARLPDGVSKQLLQTTLRSWHHQFQQRIENGFQQGRNWLTSRPEHWRNQRIARAALDLFNRGYERTGESAYQVGEFEISRKGRNLYRLKDSRGTLMLFKTARFPDMGINWRQVQILEGSDRLRNFHQRSLQIMQRNPALTPQGSFDIESNYAARTNQVERTVIQFLQTKAKAKVWDKEGGQFKLESGEGGLLRITDKQTERGVVFQRQNGEVFSKLNAQDFAHFERLAAKMQPNQNQSSSEQQTLKKSSGLELA